MDKENNSDAPKLNKKMIKKLIMLKKQKKKFEKDYHIQQSLLLTFKKQ